MIEAAPWQTGVPIRSTTVAELARALHLHQQLPWPSPPLLPPLSLPAPSASAMQRPYARVPALADADN